MHCTLYTANWTLHTAHCTLHTAHLARHHTLDILNTHCTLQNSHKTLPTAHYTTQTAQLSAHTTNCTIISTHYRLHNYQHTLHTSNCRQKTASPNCAVWKLQAEATWGSWKHFGLPAGSFLAAHINSHTVNEHCTKKCILDPSSYCTLNAVRCTVQTKTAH